MHACMYERPRLPRAEAAEIGRPKPPFGKLDAHKPRPFEHLTPAGLREVAPRREHLARRDVSLPGVMEQAEPPQPRIRQRRLMCRRRALAQPQRLQVEPPLELHAKCLQEGRALKVDLPPAVLHQAYIVAHRLHLLVDLQAGPAKPEGVVPSIEHVLGVRLERVDLALLGRSSGALPTDGALLQYHSTQPQLGGRARCGEPRNSAAHDHHVHHLRVSMFLRREEQRCKETGGAIAHRDNLGVLIHGRATPMRSTATTENDRVCNPCRWPRAQNKTSTRPERAILHSAKEERAKL